MADLCVLDVGHGSCTVLTHEKEAVIVDGGYGITLLEYLRQRRILEVSRVFISHADADHLDGISALLLHGTPPVGEVWVNRDPDRNRKAWERFRRALEDARKRGTRTRIGLCEGMRFEMAGGSVELAVLGPVGTDALGSRDLERRPQDANTLSVVIRVSTTAGGPQVLLPGDLDQTGLDNLLHRGGDLRAPVLVFPHHGGLAGSGDPAAFATRLCEAVRPDVVVFSIGRDKYKTPRPEIVRAVRTASGQVWIACTQLSMHCAAVLPTIINPLPSDRPARGRTRNACCAGSFRLCLDLAGRTAEPEATEHQAFVATYAPGALCRAPL